MSRTVVVTDSTAILPAIEVEGRAVQDVDVVALDVVIDGQSYRDGIDITPRQLAAALRAKATVSTSRPSSAALLNVYRRLAEQGADAIVSIHVSGALSGTVDTARVAAREMSIPVEVVDSGSIAVGLGHAVASAVAGAERGLELAEVAQVARARAEQTSVLFYVDTLEYLRRGGRIGTGQALLGTALAVKPLLALEHGAIELVDRVRTTSRALHRIEELAVERAGGLPTDVAVHHLDNARRAQSSAERIGRRLGLRDPVPVSEVGAVLGAHAGPGLLGIVVSPR